MRKLLLVFIASIIITGCEKRKDLPVILEFYAIESYDQFDLVFDMFKADSLLGAEKRDSLNKANPALSDKDEFLSDPGLMLNPI